MARSTVVASFPRVGDGLRLIALGRVPRCRNCPRFLALCAARAVAAAGPVPLPGVPAFCTYQICAPLASRFAAAERPARRRAG